MRAVTTNLEESADAIVAGMGKKKSTAGEGQNFNQASVHRITKCKSECRKLVQTRAAARRLGRNPRDMAECRLIHSQKPWYQVSVRRARCLPTASFRFHLAVDTLAFGCSLPTVRAAWGLAPVRIRSCWANKQETQVISTMGLKYCF